MLSMIGFNHMLTTIAIILVVLWLLGFMGGYVLGGFIHVLLVIAVILFLIRVIQGRNPLQ
jgi:asparagine N-glycosylation enzyme membrane subunit Stt3